jgi:hypothetical protein
VQQVGLLADHADDGGQVGEAHVAQVDAVDRDAAAAGVVQAGGQRGQGGLAEPVSPTRASVLPAGMSRSMWPERGLGAAG